MITLIEMLKWKKLIQLIHMKRFAVEYMYIFMKNIIYLCFHHEFHSVITLMYSCTFVTTGSMRGYLRKKGKEDNSWNLRLFVLSANENSLSYFIKDQVCD